MFKIHTAPIRWLVLLGAVALVHGARPANAQSQGHDDHDEHEHHDDHEHDESAIVIHPSAVEAFGIRVGAVERRALAPTLAAPARLAFNTERMAHIGSAVVGRVAELPVRLGDRVKPGDPLLMLDSAELGGAQSDFLQSRAMAEAALPLVELARSGYERGRKLYEDTQSVSLTEVQGRMAELQGAESALANARAALMGATNRLLLLGMTEAEVEALARTGAITPRVVLRSPIGGRVVRREVTLGELIRPEQDAILVVADTGVLWAIVEAPETRIGMVREGAEVRLRLPAFPGAEFEGVVSFISADLNEATRTAQVRVEIENPEGVLRPGMFAEAEIIGVGGGAATLAVPDAAVQTIEGETVVFVPTDEVGAYLPRPVVLGEAIGGMRPLIGGLSEGEPIVVAGSFILKAQLGKSTAKHEH